MMHSRWIVLVAALCAGVAPAGCDARPAMPVGEVRAPQEEPLAPGTGPVAAEHPLVLRDIHGKVHEPLAEAGPVACLFLLTDCPIANGYAPEIRRIHDAYAPRGIRFYLVQVDPDLAAEEARRHAREFDLPGIILLDPEHRLVGRAGATRVPEAAVFSADGEVQYCGRIDDLYVGFGRRRIEPQEHDLRTALDALLAGQAVFGPGGPTVGCHIPALPNQETAR